MPFGIISALFHWKANFKDVQEEKESPRIESHSTDNPNVSIVWLHNDGRWRTGIGHYSGLAGHEVEDVQEGYEKAEDALDAYEEVDDAEDSYEEVEGAEDVDEELEHEDDVDEEPKDEDEDDVDEDAEDMQDDEAPEQPLVYDPDDDDLKSLPEETPDDCEAGSKRCDGCKRPFQLAALLILGLCGHLSCFDCQQKHDRDGDCIVPKCAARAQEPNEYATTHLASVNPYAITREGSKLDAILELIKGNEHATRIGKNRQVLVFVQNDQIGHSVQDAFDRAGITYYSLLEKRKLGDKMRKNDTVKAINAFKGQNRYLPRGRFGQANERWKKCLVVNMFDEAAAGS